MEISEDMVFKTTGITWRNNRVIPIGDYKDLDALLFPYIVKRRWFDKKNKCWWQECIKITYDKEKYYLYVPEV